MEQTSDPHIPEPKQNDASSYIPGRFPYTYAADHIRTILKVDRDDPLVSRAQAARLKSELARILGMDEAELAAKIANDYLAKQGITLPA